MCQYLHIGSERVKEIKQMLKSKKNINLNKISEENNINSNGNFHTAIRQETFS